MKIYFDTETRTLITEHDLKLEYPDWLFEKIAECGPDYVRKNYHAEFSCEAWIEAITSFGGTLIPVQNSEEFLKVRF